MNIWLVTIGEPVPIQDYPTDRLLRTGYFANYLSGEGHNVTWWTSTFDHSRKKHLFESDTVLNVKDRLRIILLHGCRYRNNLSLSRIMNHRQIAGKFRDLSKSERSPDVIVSALPTIELCLESVAYGERHHVPVVLDMRDMWPDIFVDVLPKFVQPLVRTLLFSLFRDSAKACARATAITGITEAFVSWGLQRGQRLRAVLDRSFPLGYISKAPSPEKIREAETFWDGLGVRRESHRLVACFFGTFGRQLDLRSVIEAARILHKQEKDICYVLCGTGDLFEEHRRLAAGLPEVVLPGWVDAAAIYTLMRRAHVGLDPLPDRYDFLATINNKAIEYLSAGLPVISSPTRGVLYELIYQNNCGLSYDHGDAEGLASVLSRLYSNLETVTEMSVNASMVFRESFVAEKVYGEMASYLEEVVGSFREK
jgi:glycosyltransferase involved in cell wall biosynthesis